MLTCPKDQQRLMRAENASLNSFESIGVYAASVVAANQVGLDADTVNGLALAYAASRFAFIFIYIRLGGNRKLSGLRSAVWAAGTVLLMTLWVKTALKAMQ